MTAEGKTIALLTLTRADIRPTYGWVVSLSSVVEGIATTFQAQSTQRPPINRRKSSASSAFSAVKYPATLYRETTYGWEVLHVREFAQVRA